MKIKIFHHTKQTGKILNKTMSQSSQLSQSLKVLFASLNSKEIMLVYKSEHNYNRKNNALLIMINDDDNDGKYYFAVKSKLELYSSEWVKSKKESITNEDNCFQNALSDLLDYQRIKKDPQEI